MKTISPLQKARASYAPKLPPAFASGAAAVTAIEGAATSAVADVEKIKALYKTHFFAA